MNNTKTIGFCLVVVMVIATADTKHENRYDRNEQTVKTESRKHIYKDDTSIAIPTKEPPCTPSMSSTKKLIRGLITNNMETGGQLTLNMHIDDDLLDVLAKVSSPSHRTTYDEMDEVVGILMNEFKRGVVFTRTAPESEVADTITTHDGVSLQQKLLYVLLLALCFFYLKTDIKQGVIVTIVALFARDLINEFNSMTAIIEGRRTVAVNNGIPEHCASSPGWFSIVYWTRDSQSECDKWHRDVTATSPSITECLATVLTNWGSVPVRRVSDYTSKEMYMTDKMLMCLFFLALVALMFRFISKKKTKNRQKKTTKKMLK